MEEFDALLGVAESLLGPNGCPWDQKQTFLSLQTYVLEEAHEVIEAVDANDDRKMAEELGDLLYTVIFYAKLAEKEGRFDMKQIISTIKEKLIRRHPHVFGDVQVSGVEEIAKNWERIKKEEKGSSVKEKTLLEEMPPSLPVLVKAQKLVKKLMRKDPSPFSVTEAETSEEKVGERMVQLIVEAEHAGVDAESALRRALLRLV